MYYMLLPGGNYEVGKDRDNCGNASTGCQSLYQLRVSGKSIAAVNRSETYDTWADFGETLKAIVLYEAQGVTR